MKDNQMELPLPISAEEVSLVEIERVANTIADLREEKQAASKVLDAINKKLSEVEAQFINMMDAVGKEEYRSSKCQLSIKSKLSVKMPSTQEDKDAFFHFLREKGLYDAMATVNSSSLKSFYEASRQEAIDKGIPLMEFSIPGINEVSEYKDIGFSRNKR